MSMGHAILGFFLSLILGIPPLPAATFPCAGGDVTCLVDAITTANSNGEVNTITLEAGTYALSSPAAPDVGLPPITSVLTLTGAGSETTVIERVATAPPFRLVSVAPGGQAQLTDLTLRGGKLLPAGGAVLVEAGAALHLEHVVLRNNETQGQGGGALATLGTVTLVESAVLENVASGIRGGGGLLIRGGLTLIARTLFAGNASNMGGGAIRLTKGVLAVSGSTFVGNRAAVGGALINGVEDCFPATCVPEGVVYVGESAFVGNTSLGDAGGAIVNLGHVDVINTTFAANQIRGMPCRLANEGDVVLNRGSFVLRHSTLIGNESTRTCSVALHNAPGAQLYLTHALLARTGTAKLCQGELTSLGHNLFGHVPECTGALHATDLIGAPEVETLLEEDVPGRGHFPLLPTSPAVNAGDTAQCPATDQLGQPRVGACDIGSIELQAAGSRYPR